MSRILVTGGAGFIGAGVVMSLAARGDEVIAFDIARSPRLDAFAARHRNIEFVQGELTEWPQVMGLIQSRKPDAIVHCAAISAISSRESPATSGKRSRAAIVRSWPAANGSIGLPDARDMVVTSMFRC